MSIFIKIGLFYRYLYSKKWEYYFIIFLSSKSIDFLKLPDTIIERLKENVKKTHNNIKAKIETNIESLDLFSNNIASLETVRVEFMLNMHIFLSKMYSKD